MKTVTDQQKSDVDQLTTVIHDCPLLETSETAGLLPQSTNNIEFSHCNICWGECLNSPYNKVFGLQLIWEGKSSEIRPSETNLLCCSMGSMILIHFFYHTYFQVQHD